MSSPSAVAVPGVTDLAGIVAALRILPADLDAMDDDDPAADGLFRQEWALVGALAALPVRTIAEAADKAEAVLWRLTAPYGDGPSLDGICEEHVVLLTALVRDLRGLAGERG
jgi:hypothetical protein